MLIETPTLPKSWWKRLIVNNDRNQSFMLKLHTIRIANFHHHFDPSVLKKITIRNFSNVTLMRKILFFSWKFESCTSQQTEANKKRMRTPYRPQIFEMSSSGKMYRTRILSNLQRSMRSDLVIEHRQCW